MSVLFSGKLIGSPVPSNNPLGDNNPTVDLFNKVTLSAWEVILVTTGKFALSTGMFISFMTELIGRVLVLVDFAVGREVLSRIKPCWLRNIIAMISISTTITTTTTNWRMLGGFHVTSVSFLCNSIWQKLSQA